MKRCVEKVLTCLLVGLAVAASAPAASVTPIAAITDEPARYAGTVVTVAGTVTPQNFGYLGESLYTLQEGYRRLTVVSRSSAPATGATLEVTGTVRVRPPDEEFTFPPVLEETSRTVH